MSITFPDIAIIVLTAVAVLVTTLGVIVAIVAFFGFQHIKEQSRLSAVAAARAQIDEALSDKGSFREYIEERLIDIARQQRIANHVAPDNDEVIWNEDEQSQQTEQDRQ